MLNLSSQDLRLATPIQGGGVCLALVILLLGATPTFAQGSSEAAGVAQEYEQLPVDGSLSHHRIRVNLMLRQEAFGAGDAEIFEAYYRDCELPRWTLPENYPTLATDFRKGLRKDLASARGAVYERLNAILLDMMPAMARGNFHPAVRLNAVLMLGELNVRTPARGEDPQPLPDALPVLMALVQDETQIDAVVVGALTGVERHVRYGIADANTRSQVGAAMLKLAGATQPSDRSVEGHGWIRSKAIKILGMLQSPGPQGEVAQSLATIIADTNAPLSVRSAAAAAIGKLSLTPQTGLDALAVAKALGQLALDACRQEVQRCKRDNAVLDPRMLKSYLIPVRVGLTGVEEAVERPAGGIAALASDPETQQRINDIWKPIEVWLGKLDNKELTPTPKAAIPDAATFGREAPDPAQAASDRLIEEFSKDFPEFETKLQGAS